MLDSIRFRVKFSEIIPKETPTTPGGFEISDENGKEISFDFENSLTESCGEYRNFMMHTLDLTSFPDAASLKAEDIIKMKGFEDIFIDTDECKEGARPEKIVFFEFLFFENKNMIKIKVSPDILKRYNERMVSL